MNHGPTNETVRSVGITAIEKGGLIGSVGGGASIGSEERKGPDVPLPPGGHVRRVFPGHRLPPKTLESGGFFAYAELVSGLRVESPPQQLDGDLLKVARKPGMKFEDDDKPPRLPSTGSA